MRKIRADKGRRHGIAREDPFQPTPPEKKVSPDSLRFVLGAVRLRYHGCAGVNHLEFLDILNANWPAGRLRKGPFTKKIFLATEDGVAPFHYSYLEAYARAIGVPSGLLLLVSRLLADTATDQLAAEEIIASIERALAVMKSKVSAGSFKTRDDIAEVFQAYLEERFDE